MSRFSRFGMSPIDVTKKSAKGKIYIDWKDADTLRRMMSPNGKIYARKRLGLSAREQRMVSQAIKRARYMGLLPYTSATV
jgi:small subunit ribosomal protein S18